MRKHLFITLAAASILLAGCESDSNSSNPSECANGDVKADCADGKYSKCIDGKWTETACDNNASCNAENQCGECENDAIKDCENGDNNVGMVTICKDGQWSESKVECPSESGKVSCTADKQCGECLTGDSTKCTNDAENTGSAIMCKDGKWGTTSEFCPNQFSCAMPDACYQCYYKCDNNNTCREDCKESTCEDACKKNEACKKECDTNNGGCDSKCGACVNGNNMNCTEDASKLGSADICFNGTFSKKSCKSIKGIEVSCMSVCPKAEGPNSCSEEEYDSVCGECQNQDDLICIKEYDERYSASYENFPYPYQVVKCEEGKLWLDEDKGYRPCASDCSDKAGYDACLQN